MFVFITLAFTVIVGFTGLAVDLGFVNLERRTLQKAADAAVMSGAIDLGDTTTYGTVNTDVNAMVSRNNVMAGTTTSCSYVNNSLAVVQANCNTPTDNTTSGVKVTLSHTHQNYFLGLLGMSTVNVSATSTALVVVQGPYDAGKSLFIVCGWNTRVDGNGNGNGGTLNILQTVNGVTGLNPASIGETFILHDSQVADCGAGNNNFKGLNAQTGLVQLPNTILWDGGTQAGPTTVDVDGPGGCKAGTTTGFNGCYMWIPVVTNVYNQQANQFWGVFWAKFAIWDFNNGNKHTGQLKGITGMNHLDTSSTSSWTLGGTGILGVKMVN